MSATVTDKRINNVHNSMILLSKDNLTEDSSISIISLNHPGHGIQTKYLIDKKCKKVQEIQTFGEPHRSWLIGDTVRANGNLYISSPIDPIFLILPYVKEQCNGRAIPLEHILGAANDPHLKELLICITDLDCIADSKGPRDLLAYKYNEEKVLNWLSEKTLRVAKHLKDKNIYVKTGAVSATFVMSTLNENATDSDAYLKFAFGIISEYLNEEFCNILSTHLNICEEISVKRKMSEVSPTDSKKIKLENDNFNSTNGSPTINNSYIKNETKPKVSKRTPPTLKEKQKQKAAIGSKSIKSFFSKK